jgi:hypothetical protein
MALWKRKAAHRAGGLPGGSIFNIVVDVAHECFAAIGDNPIPGKRIRGMRGTSSKGAASPR